MSKQASLTAPPVTRRLSTLDRWLPLWIGLAMVAGLLLGRFIPGISELLSHMEIGGISKPIALGLLVMMYPVLDKVRYDKVAAVTGDKKLLVYSLVLNWHCRQHTLFGAARPLIRDGEATAVLVAINSVFQVVMFSVLGWFYLSVLPSWLGLDTQGLEVSMGQIALNVLVFLGVPLVAGFASRWIGEKRKGRDWYEE